MRNTHRRIVGLSVLAATSCATANPPPGAAIPSEPDHLEVIRAGSQAQSTGAAASFTGHAKITPLFEPTEHTRAAGASVAFTPGARTAWHTHPAGQTLIVTAGTGWVQEWGGPKQKIESGDVIWIPPNTKHWHGATPSTAMTHIAVQENVDGEVVVWLEHVAEEDYRR